jgi:signal transduction histidine kinase
VNKTPYRSRQLIEMSLPWFILVLLLAYTYAFFFRVPYSGFYFNPSNGQILEIYIKSTHSAALQQGDIIEKIGSVSRADYIADSTRTFFNSVLPGQVVAIDILRNGQLVTIPWVFPGFNREEFRSRLLDTWWLAYTFWFFGMVTQLFIRPKDQRWRSMIAVYYLTAAWLVFGSMSGRQVWWSSVLFHATTWLVMPVYLDLHWNFPKPLGRLPLLFRRAVYLISGMLALCQLFQLLARNFYILGFLILLIGSISMLVVHFTYQPEQRREVSLLALAVLVALAPTAILGIVRILGEFPSSSLLALITLPIMPAAYFFAISGRQLGGLEVRANRIISLIVYGALLLSVCIPFSFMINAWFENTNAEIAFELLLVLVVSLSSVIIYPHFQRWFENRILGMPLPPAHILELYTARIITSMETEQLRRVICEEVFPSLLIRQAAVLQLNDAFNLKTIFTLGLTEAQLPRSVEILALLTEEGKARPVFSDGTDTRPCPWVRLVLPLRFKGKPIGICLLGRRDPDDFYAISEIPTLQALMDQTALAITNIEQAEHLHALYKADIERHESELSHLALELHDDVLGQMALLSMSVGEDVRSAQFNQAYQSATEHIRQIITGLRPTMLNYGLQPALDELVDDITSLGTGTEVEKDLLANGVRYPPIVELHLFRIVQQACQNALQHTQAKVIRISGKLEPQRVDLTVHDDGSGFEAGEQLDLPSLLANKHFGLAGMYERAALIEAKINITSELGHGTSVHVTWSSE